MSNRAEHAAVFAEPGMCRAVFLTLINDGRSETLSRLIEDVVGCGSLVSEDHLVLSLAADRGWGQICMDLVKASACTESRSPNGQTALIGASHRANSTAIKILLDVGADVNAHDKGGWTPLLAACSAFWDQGRFKAVKLLVKAGSDLNAKAHEGQTALSVLAARGDKSTSVWIQKKMAEKLRDEWHAELAQAPSKARPHRV